MAIDINSLFADIIDTPEQRQQKLLQRGMDQGLINASGLTGRARALAPLAQMAGVLGVQRNEDLRRAVQPLVGIDPRTTGEKLQESLKGADTSTPEGLLQAAQSIQAIDPVRAASLRQAAIELRRDLQDRDLEREARQQSIASSKQSVSESEARMSAAAELAPYQLRAAQRAEEEQIAGAKMSESQRIGRQSLITSLMSEIPDTPENASLRALIPTMDLDRLQAYAVQPDRNMKEIEIEEFDPKTNRYVKVLYQYDTKDPSFRQKVMDVGLGDPANEYKENTASTNAWTEAIQGDKRFQELLQDDGLFRDDVSSVPLRARTLADTILRTSNATGKTPAELVELALKTPRESLKVGRIDVNAPVKGVWGLSTEAEIKAAAGQGAPREEPTVPPEDMRNNPPMPSDSQQQAVSPESVDPQIEFLVKSLDANPRARDTLNRRLDKLEKEMFDKLERIRKAESPTSTLNAQNKKVLIDRLSNEVNIIQQKLNRYPRG